MVDVLPEHSLSAEASRWVIGETEITLWSIDSPTIETEAALENLSAEEKGRAERIGSRSTRRVRTTRTT
jgi:hypothetical protein